LRVFGGDERGRKALWRGKSLLERFKKQEKVLRGFEGLHLSNFKVHLGKIVKLFHKSPFSFPWFL